MMWIIAKSTTIATTPRHIYLCFFFCNFELSISAKLWLSPSLWCSENFSPRHPYDETRPATTQWKRYYSIVIKKNNSQVIIEIQGCPTLMLFFASSCCFTGTPTFLPTSESQISDLLYGHTHTSMSHPAHLANAAANHFQKLMLRQKNLSSQAYFPISAW